MKRIASRRSSRWWLLGRPTPIGAGRRATSEASTCGGGRRSFGGRFLLARLEASEVGGAAAAFFDFIVLFAHVVFFFGFFAKRAMAFFASWTIGSPWANVAILKSSSSSFSNDFKTCFLSSMYASGSSVNPLPL